MPGLDNSDQELMIDRRAPGIVEEKEEHHGEDGLRFSDVLHVQLLPLTCGPMRRGAHVSAAVTARAVLHRIRVPFRACVDALTRDWSCIQVFVQRYIQHSGSPACYIILFLK